jgi:hypothetical protein
LFTRGSSIGGSRAKSKNSETDFKKLKKPKQSFPYIPHNRDSVACTLITGREGGRLPKLSMVVALALKRFCIAAGQRFRGLIYILEYVAEALLVCSLCSLGRSPSVLDMHRGWDLHVQRRHHHSVQLPRVRRVCAVHHRPLLPQCRAINRAFAFSSFAWLVAGTTTFSQRRPPCIRCQ